ncbi:MAG TPA: hypothetical protein VFH60_01955 [Chloroflexia bacterium]|nr:hypothetical protein [Chloroflexia bacterium]HYP21243.1 hypothetical protein [Chloroflexia bacterium]
MSQDVGKRSSRRAISWAAVGVGAILLLLVPLYLVFNAVSGSTQVTVGGTWLILSVVAGMGLVAAGAALAD